MRCNYQPLTPLSFFARSAIASPNHTAIIHGNARTSYAEFYARCRQLASATYEPQYRRR